MIKEANNVLEPYLCHRNYIQNRAITNILQSILKSVMLSNEDA